ncbi:MAG: hypothetical protein H7Y20_04290 [Bryobacteraceae bacterium]|nr:hypothetical protein [Bryobacteraceae bacterium]
MSDVENIISQLEQQRTAIDRAIAALRDITPVTPAKQAGRKATKKTSGRTPRKMSAEARRNMAEGQRRRQEARRAGLSNLEAKRQNAKDSLGDTGRKRSATKKKSVGKQAPTKKVAGQKRASRKSAATGNASTSAAE